MIWQPSHDSLLRQLYADGFSFSQIAGQLGCGLSRNAVIGRAHRIGLRGRSVTRPVKPRIPKASRRSTFVGLSREEKARRQIEARLARQQQPEPEFIGKPLMEISDGECRYPEGEGLNITFCAQPVQPGDSYCPAHCAVCYNIVPLKTRNDPAPAKHGYKPPATQLRAFGA